MEMAWFRLLLRGRDGPLGRPRRAQRSRPTSANVQLPGKAQPFCT